LINNSLQVLVSKDKNDLIRVKSYKFGNKGTQMIEVVAAIIEFKGKLLAFQRGPAKYDYVSNKFEFPGGKAEEGEDHRLALARELQEELFIKADVNDFIMTLEHMYPDFSVQMHCYLVRLDCFNGRLTEHISIRSREFGICG